MGKLYKWSLVGGATHYRVIPFNDTQSGSQKALFQRCKAQHVQHKEPEHDASQRRKPRKCRPHGSQLKHMCAGHTSSTTKGPQASKAFSWGSWGPQDMHGKLGSKRDPLQLGDKRNFVLNNEQESCDEVREYRYISKGKVHVVHLKVASVVLNRLPIDVAEPALDSPKTGACSGLVQTSTAVSRDMPTLYKEWPQYVPTDQERFYKPTSMPHLPKHASKSHSWLQHRHGKDKAKDKHSSIGVPPFPYDLEDVSDASLDDYSDCRLDNDSKPKKQKTGHHAPQGPDTSTRSYAKPKLSEDWEEISDGPLEESEEHQKSTLVATEAASSKNNNATLDGEPATSKKTDPRAQQSDNGATARRAAKRKGCLGYTKRRRRTKLIRQKQMLVSEPSTSQESNGKEGSAKVVARQSKGTAAAASTCSTVDKESNETIPLPKALEALPAPVQCSGTDCDQVERSLAFSSNSTAITGSHRETIQPENGNHRETRQNVQPLSHEDKSTAPHSKPNSKLSPEHVTMATAQQSTFVLTDPSRSMLVTACFELDVVAGLNILDICGDKEAIEWLRDNTVSCHTRRELLEKVVQAVHMAVHHERASHAEACRMLHKLSLIPWSTDPTVIQCVRQMIADASADKSGFPISPGLVECDNPAQ